MRNVAIVATGFAMILSGLALTARASDDDWVEPMKRVHAKFTGQKGVLVNLGDSISYSMAYWASLPWGQKNMSPETNAAYDLVNGHLLKDCWRWKGGTKGNASGKTAAWALKNIDGWIATLKPEVAVIMFGTNDIRLGSIEAHEKKLRALVAKCLEAGVVVILTTLPPMHGFEEKVSQTADVQRKIAADLNVPLIDFHAEILKRRPTDWDGKRAKFANHSTWEVPTLIAKDGVHLSNPTQWRGDYSADGLDHNGSVLRNYLTLRAYAEVIEKVLLADRAGSASSATGQFNPPMQAWFPKAPPLPKPTGPIVHAGNVAELYAAAEEVKPGGTIVIADGHYRMPRTWILQKNNVTLRGASNDRTRAVLDFARSQHGEGLAITNCTGVTIADLTVQNVTQNGIKINSNTGAEKVTIHNVVSHNVWQRHIKGVKVPDKNGAPDFCHGCRVQYCLFYNDRPKRHGDDPWEDGDRGSRMHYNYIGGIDVMAAKGWVIRDNVFTGIHGATRECRGAIFMWHNSTDVMIERNIIIDCDTGIALGNSSARGPRRHCTRFVVRNNFVTRCPENNILAAHTRDCRIVNNTVFDPKNRMGRLLRVVHANEGLVATNNLFSGPRISIKNNEGSIDVRNNLIRIVPDYFVNAVKGDLHLTAKAIDAIDKAMADTDVLDDIDRDKRTGKPDLGADEFVPKNN